MHWGYFITAAHPCNNKNPYMSCPLPFIAHVGTWWNQLEFHFISPIKNFQDHQIFIVQTIKFLAKPFMMSSLYIFFYTHSISSPIIFFNVSIIIELVPYIYIERIYLLQLMEVTGNHTVLSVYIFSYLLNC